MAMRKLKVKPEETIFIGDNPVNDMAGAKRVGMTTVFGKYGLWTKWGNVSMSDTKPDYVINDIRELVDIVK